MLQQPNPPVVILPDDDGADEGSAVGDSDFQEEIKAALPDLIAAIGCPDTPAYREAVEHWCHVVVCRFDERGTREAFAADDLSDKWIQEYPARALRASKFAAELGPLLERLVYPRVLPPPEWIAANMKEEDYEPFVLDYEEDWDGALRFLGRALVELAPMLQEQVEEMRREFKAQYPVRKFYQEAHSLCRQLGGTRRYFPFVKRLAAIAGIADVDKKSVQNAVNGRGKSDGC
jgi:hypothetical protein